MEERYLRDPHPRPLVSLYVGGGDALLCRSVYLPRDIGWRSGGGRGSEIDHGRCQDGGVASAGGVGISAVEIFLVGVYQQD